MQTCPACQRLMDGDECGYCWGLAAGEAYHQGGLEAVRRMNTPDKTGSGCLLVLLSGSALPVAWELGRVSSRDQSARLALSAGGVFGPTSPGHTKTTESGGCGRSPFSPPERQEIDHGDGGGAARRVT